MPAGCPGSKESNTVRPIVRDRSVVVFEFHWNKSESTTGVSLKKETTGTTKQPFPTLETAGFHPFILEVKL
jgi:hypothetical protein